MGIRILKTYKNKCYTIVSNVKETRQDKGLCIKLSNVAMLKFYYLVYVWSTMLYYY